MNHFRLLVISVCSLGLFACGKKEQAASGKTEESSKQVNLVEPVGTGIKQPNSDSDTLAQEATTSGFVLTDEERAALTQRFEAEAAQLKEKGEWEAQRFGFYEKWGKEDPLTAMTYATSEEEPGSAISMPGAVLKGWLSVDRHDARKWLDKQPGGVEKSVWLSRAVQEWPASSKNELLSSLKTNDSSPNFFLPIRTYADRFMGDNAEQIYSWIAENFEESGQLGEMQRRIMQDWATKDPETASGWLAKSSANAPWRDDAIEGLALAVRSLNPEEARTWVNAIKDEKRREEALARLQGPR